MIHCKIFQMTSFYLSVIILACTQVNIINPSNQLNLIFIIFYCLKCPYNILQSIRGCVGYTGSLECLLMVQEIGVQSHVEPFQRLKNWYLILPCLTLGIIRCISRVKWSNPEKRVAPPPTPLCRSYLKEGLRVALDSSRQLYFFTCAGSSNTSYLIIVF